MFRCLLFTVVLGTSMCNFLAIGQITDRSEAVIDYFENYENSSFGSEELAWNGNISSCMEGTISTSVKNKLIQRTNYFRRMVGVADQIIFTPSKNLKCQKAALIMTANDALNHQPPSHWLCYSNDGYEAADKSNLWGGSTLYSPSIDYHNPITDYVDDYIEAFPELNISVGHRRWLLNSKAKTFGVGQTNHYNALWVVPDSPSNPDYSNFIAYPPAGYIPGELVFKRWSFGIPNADFSNVEVSVKDQNNTNIPISIIYRSEYGVLGSGDNSIVWETNNPNQIITDSHCDVEYVVTISNISNAPQSSYEYTTTLFNPQIGDVNLDMTVNILDAFKVAQFAVELLEEGDCNSPVANSEICLDNADANNDGTVNILDAYQIARLAVGLNILTCD